MRDIRSVLDASALLAYLWNEPAADVVREALSRRATMSTVNWAEVLSLADRACLATGRRLGVPVLTADRTWRGLSIEVTIQVIRP